MLAPVRRIEAAEATLGDGAWTLKEVKDWPLAESSNPERDAITRDRMRLPSDLTPERIRDGSERRRRFRSGTCQTISLN